jgi:hypothetical protein
LTAFSTIGALRKKAEIKRLKIPPGVGAVREILPAYVRPLFEAGIKAEPVHSVSPPLVGAN